MDVANETFYIIGAFQKAAGDAEYMSQPSLNRHFHQVVDALCNRKDRFIQFPTDPAVLKVISKGFYDFAGFPNVVGIVDGTQIPIYKPHKNAENYVNRKGFHSLNMQVGKYSMLCLILKPVSDCTFRNVYS